MIRRRHPIRRSSRPIRRNVRPRNRRPNPKGTRAECIRYASGLWSKLVKAKSYEGRCMRCHSRPGTDAAHGWPKGGLYAHVRLHINNGLWLCRGCHELIDRDAREKWALWARYYTEEQREALRREALGTAKLDLDAAILLLESLTIETARAR